LTISNELGDRQGTRIYLSNIGRVYRTLGQLQPAFEHFGRAIALFDEQRASIKGDEIKTTFANRGQALYSDMVQICISMNKRVEALEFVGQAKSRALLDLLSNSPIDISELAGVNADDALKALIAREIELRRQITTLKNASAQMNSMLQKMPVATTMVTIRPIQIAIVAQTLPRKVSITSTKNGTQSWTI